MDAVPAPPPAAVATASPAATAQVAPPRGVFDILPQRDPTTAALLSLAVNGAGQFYNGEAAKGWWMLAPWALFPVAWLADSYLETGYFRTGALVVGIGVKGYSVWDAYFSATAPKELR